MSVTGLRFSAKFDRATFLDTSLQCPRRETLTGLSRTADASRCMEYREVEARFYVFCCGENFPLSYKIHFLLDSSPQAKAKNSSIDSCIKYSAELKHINTYTLVFVQFSSARCGIIEFVTTRTERHIPARSERLSFRKKRREDKHC